MASVVTRQAYFHTGLDVLAGRGYGGLKLAEVCRRLGVTTGSFYHYFDSWSAYTGELIRHWQVLTRERVDGLRANPDPRNRIDAIMAIGLQLPHGAEAAIRVWSALDPQVRAAQEEVDRMRFDVIRDSAREFLDERHAHLFARSAVYLLIGYEQCTLPPDTPGLVWITQKLVESLVTGWIANEPPAPA